MVVPGTAFEEAEILIYPDDPGIRVRVAGDAVTPVGRIPIVTVMLHLKPLTAEACTVIVSAGPIQALQAMEQLREKSLIGFRHHNQGEQYTITQKDRATS